MISCQNLNNKNAAKTLNSDTFLENSRILNDFSQNNLILYKNILDSIFRIALNDKKVDFEIEIDTISDDSIQGISTIYLYQFIPNKKYEWIYLNQFKVFDFKTEEVAQYYFDSLYTLENINFPGINKSPNFILKRNNQIIWNYLHCSYAHKYDAIISNFKKIFYLNENLQNTDSIIYKLNNYSKILDYKIFEGSWVLKHFSAISDNVTKENDTLIYQKIKLLADYNIILKNDSIKIIKKVIK